MGVLNGVVIVEGEGADLGKFGASQFSVFHSLLMVAGICCGKVWDTSRSLGAFTFYLMLP